MKTWTWQVSRIAHNGSDFDQTRLDILLASGWEPFAVTQVSVGEVKYHLRRQVYGSK